MKLLLTLLLASLAAATDILLPLYIYPSVNWKDNATRWQPLLTQIRAHPSLLFYIIVNPASGPGALPVDVNYQDGVALLNAEPNVHTVGYVRVDYGRQDPSVIAAQIDTWTRWSAPFDVQGVFFDETPSVDGTWDIPGDRRTYAERAWGVSEAQYMSDLAALVRTATFPSPDRTVVFNVGKRVDDANLVYFDVADTTIVFESRWEAYQTADPVANNIPPAGKGGAAKGSILVHTYTGTVGQLESELGRIKGAGFHSAWFTNTVNVNDGGNEDTGDGYCRPPGDSGTFCEFSREPANVVNQARVLA